MSRKFQNPVIPGYYPDPSICRVGDDYYLACSSFELVPGIPVFHSRDLVHWEQICNAITEKNGLHMEMFSGIGGLMAPTIRYHNGLFYIINTNFADKGNYIITAENPAGPWSDPHWLTDVPEIDASIFFDGDGQAYVIGTGNVWDNGAGQKERGFWLAKYDVVNFKMIGEPVTIFNSALRVGSSPEAPHIYHIGEYYYLLFAEGGTEHFHSVMVARSKELFGFYEGFEANPVLTHRHMGYKCPITNVGHADLVEDQNGQWWAVFLASRLVNGVHKNLGRETFMCPVIWERGWPMFTPETGKVEWEYDAPELPEVIYPPEGSFDHFDSGMLPLYWTVWGTAPADVYRYENSHASLKCVSRMPDEELRPIPVCVISDENYCAFLARRQRSHNATMTCAMTFTPAGNERAGIAVVQALNHQLHLERAVSGGKQVVRAVQVTSEYNHPPYIPGFESRTDRTVLAEKPWKDADIVLQVEMHGMDWTVRVGADRDSLQELCKADGAVFNPEKVGCMVGTMLGMYATGSGTESENRAEFDWFELKQDER